MMNYRITFNFLEKDDHAPVGYKLITFHLIFDAKIDHTRKAKYVAGGHITNRPSSMTYSSVVIRNSVRLASLIAALNYLDILAGDIQNAYLNAPTKYKVFFYAGDEWKYDHGKFLLLL